MLGNGTPLHSFLAYTLLRKSDVCSLGSCHLVLPLFLWLTQTRLTIGRVFVEINSSPVTPIQMKDLEMQHPTPLLPAEAISKDRETSLKKAVGVMEGCVNWELPVHLSLISFKSYGGSVVC